MRYQTIRFRHRPYMNPRTEARILEAESFLRQYGQPLDNYIADHEYIEGSADDMRYKAQLPNGKWISAESTQQLVDKIMEQTTQPVVRKDIPLLRDYIREWFETYKLPKLRQGTAKNYLNDINKHIIPYFYDLRLDEIDTHQIQQFYTAKAHLAKSTVHHLSIYLNQIFNSAIEDGYIQRNPAQSKRLTMSRKVTVREDVKPEYLQQIIRQLNKLEPLERVMLSILIYTGARRGEMLALQWSDIDFENNLIHISRAVTYSSKDSNTPVIGKTKSDAGVRNVPLLPELKVILAPFRQISGFVVHSANSETPLSQSAFRRAWERIGKVIPVIAENGYTPHQFRHAFATAANAALDGYEVIPCSSNWGRNPYNTEDTLEYFKTKAPENMVLGYMTAPWKASRPEDVPIFKEAFTQLKEAREKFYGKL